MKGGQHVQQTRTQPATVPAKNSRHRSAIGQGADEIIYRPARSPMRSASGPQQWILEFEPTRASQTEPLMGWTTTSDPYRPIRLRFPDCERAINYAERNDWLYIVRDDQRPASRERAKNPFRKDDRRDRSIKHIL